MKKVDYHIHTDFSDDAVSKTEDVIKRAITLGLNEIAITDHIEFDSPPSQYVVNYNTVVFDEYDKNRLFLKEKYANKINIILGAEIGLKPDVKDQVERFVKNNNLDFIIGSTHTLDNFELHLRNFGANEGKPKTYKRYFNEVLNSARLYDEFDVYGHLDVIVRYVDYTDRSFKYEQYSNILDDILNTIINKGKGIELNTSGLRYGMGASHPQFDIIKRYRELGGEIITVGSDAHFLEDIYKDCEYGYAMLQKAGFSQLTLFRQRKPLFISL